MAKSVIDLEKMTSEAIKSHVLSKTATSPLTIWPILAGVGLIAFWVIFNASWIFTLLGGLGFAAGATWFAVSFFARFDVYQAQYFKDLRAESDRQAKEKLASIRIYLKENDWEQGADQVEKLQAKMESFEEVLLAKFKEGELAYSRYHTVAEKTFLTALENLQDAVVKLKAVDTIDPEYIERRWNELVDIEEHNGSLTESQKAEGETLKERWALREKNFEEAEVLMALNEKAMTELDKFSSKLAATKTDGADAEDELRKAISRLDDLGAEAEKNWS